MTEQENSFDISLAEIHSAATRRDPSFAQQLLAFLAQHDPPLPDDAPNDAMSLETLRYNVLFSYQLRRTGQGDARMHYRQQQWEQYLQQDINFPPRLKLDEVVLGLYEDGSEWCRQTLLTLINEIPLKWGPWRGIKQIFKRAEQAHDFEMLAAIAVRCDVVSSNPYSSSEGHEVTNLTLAYLRRRGWRYLRHLGQSLPALYPHAAVQFLRWYPTFSESWYEDQLWRNTWIINHIFYHEHKKQGGGRQYGPGKFKYGPYYNKMPSSPSKYRAYPTLWEQSPEPLLDLLLLCRADRVAKFAVELLREQFTSTLRQLPLPHMIRLGQRSLPTIQLFVKSWIEENPSLQKAQFRELGLHELLLDHFLYSEFEEVRKYAISYARDYAKDLSIDRIIKLFQTYHDDLHKFAKQLLTDRDPREGIGLEQLQQLLLLDAAFDLAKKKLEEGFRPGEIPTEWFKPLLFSNSWDVVNYTVSFLKKKYPSKQLDLDWFQDLLADERMDSSYYGYMVREYVEENLRKRAKSLSTDWLQQALLHPDLQYSVWNWLEEGKIKPEQLDLTWLQALVSPTDWDAHPWVQAQEQQENRWVKDLSYPHHLKDNALSYLRDKDNFAPQTLGLDWLLRLLQQQDKENEEFALRYLLENFNPADLADPDDMGTPATVETAAPAGESPFAEKSVLFTGKLRNLSRAEAQAKVKEVGGVIAKSVTKDLDFLVIGDEGSPLFAEGKKGSKMVKAEKYQEEGFPIQIISETAWLSMVSEGSAAQADVDVDAVASGYRRLIRWASEEDQPPALQSFAVQYLQERHPLLGSQRAGRPLPGETVIPRSLYRSEDFLPLLADERTEVQKLAVGVARYELRQWQVPPAQIFLLCESPYRPVRSFAIEALLGPEEGETAEPFHFKPEELDPALVFALCESRRRAVRHAGITLLQRHYDLLQGDQQILRLAESPDRDIRTQAVRILWMRYRRPPIAAAWSPKRDFRSAIPPKAPIESISDSGVLLQFARMVLFGLPPGKLEKRPQGASKPWSNSKAKVHMINVLRDLALEDQTFAQQLTPLLEQFLASHHKMEALGSLTAITQIQQKWEREQWQRPN